ncbi:MAG TPA: cell wall hydrolase [Nitrospira sp.]|nr:cell wall hydrolase [Nitrospira sp.]
MKLVLLALAPFPLMGLGYFGVDPSVANFAQFKQQMVGKSSDYVRTLSDAAATLAALPDEADALFQREAKGPRADRYLEIITTQSVPRQARVMLASLGPGPFGDITGSIPHRLENPADAINRDEKSELLMTPATFGHSTAAMFLSVLRDDFERVEQNKEKAKLERKIDALESPRLPRTLAYQGETEAEFVERQHRCLATAIYFEARGEPEEGQLAVAQVIMNRVRSPDWPDTICGVVYQGQWNKSGCQFSFACDGRSDTPKDQGKWELAMRLAKRVTNGEVFLKDIGHATHYHATYVNPRWSREMSLVERIGQHLFYKLRGGDDYVVPPSVPNQNPERGLALSGSG